MKHGPPQSSVSSFSPQRLKRKLLDQKDALLCIVDQGVVSVAGFGTSVLIGRSNPEELGVYFIAWSIVYFIRGFQQQMICVPYTNETLDREPGVQLPPGVCVKTAQVKE